jgi:hypothetical protein
MAATLSITEPREDVKGGKKGRFFHLAPKALDPLWGPMLTMVWI